jgi:flagellin
MSIGFKHNLSSLNAQRSLSNASAGVAQAFQRLSSGKRFNSASDDASGLAIAERLRGDSRVATVGVRNANDAISMINVADGAIGQIGNILNRLLELAQQSANAVNGPEQRSALQNEYAALTSEIERVASTTEFNGFQVLRGGDSASFQIGFDGTSLSSVSFSGIRATLADLGLAQAGSSVATYSLIAATDIDSRSASLQAVDALKSAVFLLNHNRGILGAAQSRLETAIANLQVARENFTSTESKITDADTAEEASNLSRQSILQQASTAILAQANLQPQLVMRLLQD